MSDPSTATIPTVSAEEKNKRGVGGGNSSPGTRAIGRRRVSKGDPPAPPQLSAPPGAAIATPPGSARGSLSRRPAGEGEPSRSRQGPAKPPPPLRPSPQRYLRRPRSPHPPAPGWLALPASPVPTARGRTTRESARGGDGRAGTRRLGSRSPMSRLVRSRASESVTRRWTARPGGASCSRRAEEGGGGAARRGLARPSAERPRVNIPETWKSQGNHTHTPAAPKSRI